MVGAMSGVMLKARASPETEDQDKSTPAEKENARETHLGDVRGRHVESFRRLRCAVALLRRLHLRGSCSIAQRTAWGAMRNEDGKGDGDWQAGQSAPSQSSQLHRPRMSSSCPLSWLAAGEGSSGIGGRQMSQSQLVLHRRSTALHGLLQNTMADGSSML